MVGTQYFRVSYPIHPLCMSTSRYSWVVLGAGCNIYPSMLFTRRLFPGPRLKLLVFSRFGAAKEVVVPTHQSHALDHHDHHDDLDHAHDDHGHHHKAYDWRDDFSKNLDFEENVIHRGTPDPREYDFPFKAQAKSWSYSHPEQYNPKDLTQVYMGGKEVGPISNQWRAPIGNIEADIAHEYDYESEDVDFQPESFKTQHFRKKGMLIIWILTGAIPYLYVCSEFFFQKFPSENHWRMQRPPPFEYPDAQDTPDTYDDALFDSPQYKILQEAGIVGERFFKLDGKKKIYLEGSGVNQPMADI